MRDLAKTKVLVTGADGFIGSHLVEALQARGADVTAFVQYNSFGTWGWLDSVSEDVKQNINVIAGDIRDRARVTEAMRGADVVLHLAALIAIPYSYGAAESYIETNIGGTLNILEAAKVCQPSKVVCTSTSEVYGTALTVPITEDHPLQAQSPYAASKAGADLLALSYQKSFEMPVAVLRPFNTYGPRQSTRAVIPTIITQLAGGHNRIKLGALSPTRDFTFVTDTAAGFVAMAESDAGIGEVTNIGSGFEVSIGDTAKMIAEVMGREIEIESDEARLRPEGSEVERLFAGDAKARASFGWDPEHGGPDGFLDGLKKTADWFQDPENLKHYKQGYQT